MASSSSTPRSKSKKQRMHKLRPCLQEPLDEKSIDFGTNCETDSDDDEYGFHYNLLKEVCEEDQAEADAVSEDSFAEETVSKEGRKEAYKAESKVTQTADKTEEETHDDQEEDDNDDDDEISDRGRREFALFYEVLACVQREVQFVERVTRNVHKVTLVGQKVPLCLKVGHKTAKDRKTNSCPMELRVLSRLARVSPPLQYVQRLLQCVITKNGYGFLSAFVPSLEVIEEQVQDWKHDKKLIRTFMYQLLSAITELHDNGIMHRDIKLSNILWDVDKQQLTLADLGHGTWILKEPHVNTHAGSWNWTAPEMMHRARDATDGPRSYSEKVDEYSAGVVFGCLLWGLCGREIEEFHANIFRELAPIYLPKETSELLCSLLRHDPNQRVSAKQALQFAYFKQ